MTTASARVLLFWDYDAQWGTDSDRARRLPTAPLGHREFEHTERLLEIHTEYGVPACFAVVGSAALPGERPYHDPQQIRRVHGAGHEVASHAFRHEWLPGLRRLALLDVLRRSKDALEQCIGAEVISFVPPYNQPYDYGAGWSFSLSERLEAGRHRTDLRGLCTALRETGYRFCRVGYWPLHLRLAERLIGRRLNRLSQLEQIDGVTCVGVTVCGFDARAVSMLDRCAAHGGFLAVYAHPHSLRSGNSQDESHLIPFLQRLCDLRRQGVVRACLPRDLVQERVAS
jgi:peptidoglycan/xylan/chitin deacetylase (PgdA/CDA1 family)